jgi:hypothetical protein
MNQSVAALGHRGATHETDQYPKVELFIDGFWEAARGGKTLPVHNPATGAVIGSVGHAERVDLDRDIDQPFRPGFARNTLRRNQGLGARIRRQSRRICSRASLPRASSLLEAECGPVAYTRYL